MDRIQLARNYVQWWLLGKRKLNLNFNKSWVIYLTNCLSALTKNYYQEKYVTGKFPTYRTIII